MSVGYYANQYFTTQLSVTGGINDSQTTGIVLQSVTGIQNTTKPGIALINYADPLNETLAEWVTFTSINSTTKTLVGVTRGAEKGSAKSHDNNVTVAFPISESHQNPLVDAVSIGGVATNIVTTTLDEDTMSSNSATALATQQSIKAYVDTQDTLYTNYNIGMARQAIINGNFDVWQRGTSFNNPNAVYTADRWKTASAVDTYVKILRSTEVPNTSSSYSMRVEVMTATGNTNAFTDTQQPIEDYSLFIGKTVTYSLYAKCDAGVTGEMIIVGGVAGSPTTSITSTSWTKYTLTVKVDTGISTLYPIFRLYRGGQVVGKGINIAQVQLNAGDVALPFQPKSYEEELRACQRYCRAFTPETINGATGALALGSSATAGFIQIPLSPEMRIAPTSVTVTAADWKVFDGSASVDLNAMALATNDTNSKNCAVLSMGAASGLTQYRPYFLICDGTANRALILSAEL